MYSWHVIAGVKSKRSRFDELSLAVLMHYLFYIALMFMAAPESYCSTGPHEPVGDCDSISYINTVSGTVSDSPPSPPPLSLSLGCV